MVVNCCTMRMEIGKLAEFMVCTKSIATAILLDEYMWPPHDDTNIVS